MLSTRYPLVRKIFALVALLALGVFFGRDVLAGALVARSDAYLSAGDAASAVKFVSRALFFDPTYPDAAQRLGLLAIRSRRRTFLEHAIGVEAQAIRRDPRDQNLRIVYADGLYDDGDFAGSARAWALLAHDYPSTVLYEAWAAHAAWKAGACDIADVYLTAIHKRERHDPRVAAMVRDIDARKGSGTCASS